MDEIGPPRRTLCAALIVKDEARHIEEWIVYHHLIGVEHFYVYDNDSTDDLRAVLAPYITRGLVTYIYWPQFPGQFDAYAHAVQATAPFTEWLCLFDADEFLALKQVEDLRAYLRDLPFDQVLVRWRMFGHSGHREPQPGLTVDTYVHSSENVHHIVKAIVRPRAVKQTFVHYCRTERRLSCSANGEPVREGWALREHAGSQALELNHYYTRSYEEYVTKMARGDANRGEARPTESYERWDFQRKNEGLAAFAPAIRAFISAIRERPVSPLRSGSLSAGNVPIASPNIGYWFGRVVEALREALVEQDPAIDAKVLHRQDGPALAVFRPSEDALRKARAFVADRFAELVESKGLMPIGMLHAEASDGPKRHRPATAPTQPAVLPGYVLAVFIVEPSANIQTLRLQASERGAADDRKLIETLGVAADTLHVAARVTAMPCRPDSIEVRWIDQWQTAGALQVHLALIV